MEYLLYVLTGILLYSIVTLTMNLLLGYLGILYLAHPAIFGFGAYTFAILSQNEIGFFWALIAGGFVAMLAGLVVALPSLRLKSHYIGMSTLAFLFIANNLFINNREITNGARGMNAPRPTIFGELLNTNLEFFLFTLVVSSVIFLILYRITSSPFAKIVESIREDETSTKTLGENTYFYKIKIFMVATFFGGIAGGLLASYWQFISPKNFSIHSLIFITAMVIVGGMASFWGSILGVVVIHALSEGVRFLPLDDEMKGAFQLGIYGLLIILFMLFKPTGILGRRTNIFSK